jgi:MinD superfamily P-loop ATPase
MKIAIASGKGGTGKTTVCASLVSVWDRAVTAVDLDVEEPNLHLFLKPEIVSSYKSYAKVPKLDDSRCTGCGACANICQFSAISMINKKPYIFPEMCHDCGGCFMVCPTGALKRSERELGEVISGKIVNGKQSFVMGKLRVGEAMSPPLMREIKNYLSALPDVVDGEDIIIDAPPGTSCPAMNAVMDCDYIVMVTEPTPFGLHDLKLAVEAFTPLDKPMGVVVNRSGAGGNDDEVESYCNSVSVPVIAKIPFSRDIATAYSNGQIIADISADYKDLFLNLAKELKSYA